MQLIASELGLRRSQCIAGFALPSGGPVCPFFSLPLIPADEPLVPIIARVGDVRFAVGPLLPKRSEIAELTWSELLEHVDDIGSEKFVALSRAVVRGLESDGFVRVRAGDVELAAVRRAQQAALAFFALPAAVKAAHYTQLRDEKYVGYRPDGAREFFQMRTLRRPMPWPGSDTCPGLDAAFGDLFRLQRKMARTLLAYVAHGLRLDARQLFALLDDEEPRWSRQPVTTRQPTRPPTVRSTGSESVRDLDAAATPDEARPVAPQTPSIAAVSDDSARHADTINSGHAAGDIASAHVADAPQQPRDSHGTVPEVGTVSVVVQPTFRDAPAAGVPSAAESPGPATDSNLPASLPAGPLRTGDPTDGSPTHSDAPQDGADATAADLADASTAGERDAVPTGLPSQASSAPVPSPPSSADAYVGADVMRVYQYYRPPGTPPPGLQRAATGLHADMGLLTVSPLSSLPGLVMLDPSCTHWIDAESTAEPTQFIAFAGETMGRLSGGRLRAPLHFVDERVIGQPRVSMPFFLRGRPEAALVGDMTVQGFIENVVFARRPWNPQNRRPGALPRRTDY